MPSNKSDKLRREAAELQALARRLMDQAEELITTSKELEKKIEGRDPKKILGHDNLDVTAHYAQVSTRLMLKEYKAAHPHPKAA
jgi:hypothetical protein